MCYVSGLIRGVSYRPMVVRHESLVLEHRYTQPTRNIRKHRVDDQNALQNIANMDDFFSLAFGGPSRALGDQVVRLYFPYPNPH